MQPTISSVSYNCLRSIAKRDLLTPSSCARLPKVQYFSTCPAKQDGSRSRSPYSKDEADVQEEQQQREAGAMSRRLSQLSEEGLEAGGRRAAKAVEEAGFDEDMKRKLEERIASANFRNDNIRAFAEAELPTSAGRQTRDLATAAPWSGTESVEDASLRMLNDSIKPIRVSRKAPPIQVPPARVDTGRSRTKPSSGARLANARDKTSIYAQLKEMPENEREQFRKEMKERFTANARSVPVSITGLESLASQRIEDAIARGQFKNLPRGKVIERDYNASSPFIDTTEYLLNRMIQRQEIVPPWIEKQQELVSTATRFRGRLRSDWRRHIARSISSRGGSLESQMALAEEYALAETIHNPSLKKVEKLNAVDEGGHLSQITLTGEFKSTDVIRGSQEPQVLKVTEETIDLAGEVVTPEGEANLTVQSSTPSASTTKSSTRAPSVPPFRDPQWLQIERAYHKVAIENLNTLTRSYNLMCPQLAQRPYFDLQRELNACFAEVAPLVAQEIQDRAFAPKVKVETFGTKPPSVLEKFAGGPARVYDERKPQYGFKELIKDWFRRDKTTT